jgi:hypothetical protein
MLSELKTMSVADLKQLKRNIQMLLEDKAAAAISTMSIGDNVKINHRKAPGKWIIRKINRKTVVLEQDGRSVKSTINLLTTI